MKMIGMVLCLLAAAAMAGGCTGSSREVDSCSECNDNANWRADEYCVEGEYGQLYCANPCISHASCAIDQWCVPLMDEGTPWTTDGELLRWVCMEESFYTGLGSVWRTEDDCGVGELDECPSGMQCLYDDYDPYDVTYFCSDPCDYDSDCLTGCCEYNSGYCAPYHPYCD